MSCTKISLKVICEIIIFSNSDFCNNFRDYEWAGLAIFISLGQCHWFKHHHNHANSNLAIYSHETSQDKLSDSILLSSRCMASCSFLHAHFLWLRICLKKLVVKNSFIEKTDVVGTHWNCLLLKIKKKTIFQVTSPLSLPLLNIPNCQSVSTFLSLKCKLFIFA